jgi:hypothetical protein
LLRSWLAAAHGEVHADNGDHANSLREFDQADIFLGGDTVHANDPYVALDSVHLARWRGHALAQCGNSEALDVLTRALDGMDTSFVRAEVALRVDLATTLSMLSDRQAAAAEAENARQLAVQIGSVRQERKLMSIKSQYRSGHP